MLTGVHYAEEPLSRTTHLISNVRVLDVRKDEDNQLLISTSCHFIMYLNRVEYEVNLLAGKRYDTLIATGDS
ncbi:aromatic-ring-hydroxylating dioxygenase subunit beta, partial [Escherichia fergusonii]